MIDIGTVLFVLALIVTFMYPRIAGAIGLASSLLCLPLYLFFIAPVTFNQIFGFGHQFKVQPSGGFHWERWPIAGVLTLAVTIYVCLRSLAVTSRTQSPERG
jgi:energy-coupling factor transporter transmembrane protein EcfT